MEALEILNQKKIHCILMDVMMPKMDGIQAIMHLSLIHICVRTVFAADRR